MTCKTNERSALNTKFTKEVLENQNIVVLKADMTNEALEVEDTLQGFGNSAKAIPYYAVYRPDEEPHHFAGNFAFDGAKGFLDSARIAYSTAPESGKANEEAKSEAGVVADARAVPGS